MMQTELHKTRQMRDVLLLADSETRKRFSGSFDEFFGLLTELDATKEFSVS